MKKFLTVLAAGTALFALSGSFCSSSEFDTFSSGALSGSNEVPPVETSTSGTFQVELHTSEDRGRVNVFTTIPDGDVTGAHLHVAAAGANCPVVVNLTPDGAASFLRDFDATGLTGNGGITTWQQFLDALEAGNIYVNIHTAANPGGQLRGQVVGS